MINVTVDIKIILDNIDKLRKKLGKDADLCIVVKGDAYGCGDVEIARIAQNSGKADMLAVGIVEEAINLRKNGITMPILLLGDMDNESAGKIIEYNIIPTIYRRSFILALNEAAKDSIVPVHLRFDVCNGSSGIQPDEICDTIEYISTIKNVKIAGVYSQLYGAYSDDEELYQSQKASFDAIVESIPKDIRDNICIHTASTPAICRDKTSHYDMVRSGAAVYGLPYDEGDNEFDYVMTIKSVISDIKRVRGTQFAGYTNHHNNNERVIATMAGGYEDAIYLLFAQDAYVLVDGKKAPIVGDCCMDTILIDITGIEDVQVGDEVVLLGKQSGDEITPEDIMLYTDIAVSKNQIIYKTGKRVNVQYVNYPKKDRLDKLLHQVKKFSPTINRVLNTQAQVSVRQYLSSLNETRSNSTLQDKEDILPIIEKQLLPVIGEKAVKEALLGIGESLHTANHHGVDSMAQSVQGNYLYMQMLRQQGVMSSTIPVMACTNVPLDNSNYGKGLLVYDTSDDKYPLRIPIIPNKFRKSIVGLFPKITEKYVEDALNKVRTPRFMNLLSDKMLGTIEHVLSDVYMSEDAQKHDGYVDQSTYINHYLTKKAFGTGFAYISIEQTAAQLIIKDLRDEKSISRSIVEDGGLRTNLINHLSGVDGCWNTKNLINGTYTKSGSILFWAAGNDYRRHPMIIRDDRLCDLNSDYYINMTASEIITALEEARIYPTLFMSFLPILFERGFRCYGGSFQPYYLAKMQKGLADALNNNGYKMQADAVLEAVTDSYISGPMLFNVNNAPAGILELISQGIAKNADKCLDMSMLDAHRLGLSHLYMDIVSSDYRIKNWRDILFNNNYYLR